MPSSAGEISWLDRGGPSVALDDECREADGPVPSDPAAVAPPDETPTDVDAGARVDDESAVGAETEPESAGSA